MRFSNLEIQRQPDETTCGPTCLHAVYRYYGEDVSLESVIETVPSLANGGTLAVLLATHALQKGYQATIYTYNLQIFDPTWFKPHRKDLRGKLRAQQVAKPEGRVAQANQMYLEYLKLGGHVEFQPLTRTLLRELLEHKQPLLTGLSATYLYQEAREIPETSRPDDVQGYPSGHFVVICGYDDDAKQVWIADPLHPNPLSQTNFYSVHVDLLLGAIMLGVMTYDANLLMLGPRQAPQDALASRTAATDAGTAPAAEPTRKGVPAWNS